MNNQYQEWLNNRKKGIGASEAAAILGVSPFKTNLELWQEKTGRKEAEDISDKPYVQYGNAAEPLLRKLFALDFPNYKVDYDQYKLVANNKKMPYIFATLDGEIINEKNKKGILEIKTVEILRSNQYSQWKNENIPQYYYIQVLHQFIATGYSYACLKAQIKFSFDNVRLETKHYWLNRADVIDDITYLKQKEKEFWEVNILQDKEPALILPSL